MRHARRINPGELVVVRGTRQVQLVEVASYAAGVGALMWAVSIALVVWLLS